MQDANQRNKKYKRMINMTICRTQPYLDFQNCINGEGEPCETARCFWPTEMSVAEARLRNRLNVWIALI